MKFQGQQLSRWSARATVVALLAVLCFLAGFAIITQSREATLSQRADAANNVSSLFQDARFWVGQEESLERKYRLEPGAVVLRAHEQAEDNFERDLRRLLRSRPSPANRAVAARLLGLETSYARASTQMFRAVDAHRPALVIHFDHKIVDPVFGVMENIVYVNAAVATRRSLAQMSALRRSDAAAKTKIATAFAVGVALLLILGLSMSYFRRRLDDELCRELERLSVVAITDPLTGLRNHRAFHEDLARSLQRTSRTDVPLSLVMLDLDALKAINDEQGHQVGDDGLRALARAMLVTVRGSDCVYRVGGDEFAVILDGTRAWNALEFVYRLQASMAESAAGVSVSAGVAEASGLRDKDTLIREADLALMATKRSGQAVSVYTSDMDRPVAGPDALEEHQERTLADALALAVDAKDSYTRSHSQTVAQLSALIAAELGFSPQRIADMRLAGLLHDVGKIGIPDAILNKPAKLTDAEYDQMKTHALLGHDIVHAADMPTKSRWIRHHHERYDGFGYPDQLKGEAIPLESRIIFVADAFDAMTSNRPYRVAPGQQFALDELRRHAGSQFDPDVVQALCRILERPANPPDAELPVATPAGHMSTV
jgi:diguanylate cyclase (GGDEF)-like protein